MRASRAAPWRAQTLSERHSHTKEDVCALVISRPSECANDPDRLGALAWEFTSPLPSSRSKLPGAQGGVDEKGCVCTSGAENPKAPFDPRNTGEPRQDWRLHAGFGGPTSFRYRRGSSRSETSGTVDVQSPLRQQLLAPGAGEKRQHFTWDMRFQHFHSQKGPLAARASESERQAKRLRSGAERTLRTKVFAWNLFYRRRRSN